MERERLDAIKKHKFIILCYEHYAPLGVIRSLGENGIYPIVIVLDNPKEKIASASKYISKIHTVKSFDEGVKLLLNLT